VVHGPRDEQGLAWIVKRGRTVRVWHLMQSGRPPREPDYLDQQMTLVIICRENHLVVTNAKNILAYALTNLALVI
jgi:hypothetical protein